jgi:hypothetical protein
LIIRDVLFAVNRYRSQVGVSPMAIHLLPHSTIPNRPIWPQNERRRTTKPNNLISQKGNEEIIRDIGGLVEDGKFAHEANGFVYRKYFPLSSTKARAFLDPELVEKVFLPESDAILRNEVEGGTRYISSIGSKHAISYDGQILPTNAYCFL